MPDLIHLLTGHLGPITRVGLDATAWDELPTRLVVVPPHATPDAALAAMARAVRADDVTHAAEILIATGTHQAHPIPAEDPRTGEKRHEPEA
ncbi:hypothetical protein [Streptomyces sp. NPDC002172]